MTTDPGQCPPLLKAQGLLKTFGGVTAVNNVDVDIHRGEILGLIGPNGAGKSTCFNCLSGVTEPDQGTVLFEGDHLVPPISKGQRLVVRLLGLWQVVFILCFWSVLTGLGAQALLTVSKPYEVLFKDIEVLLGAAALLLFRLSGAYALTRFRMWSWGMHMFLGGADILMGGLALAFAHKAPETLVFSITPDQPFAPALWFYLCGAVAIGNGILIYGILPKQWAKGVMGIFSRSDAINKKGMARTFQNIRLFKQLSVLDNVTIGAHGRTHNGLFSALLRMGRHHRGERRLRDIATECLRLVNLEFRGDDLAGSLAYGQQRRLEIARALASDPKLLLLDEPAAGMNHTETAELVALIRRIRERGVAVLVIEHDMRLIMKLCDRVVVLDHGAKISEGTPEEIANDPKVIAAYLGEETEEEVA